MSGLQMLVNLLGGVALLIWSTRMVRVGVLRAFGEKLRSVLAAATGNRLSACAGGMLVAAMLQSSAATGVLIGSFAQRGLIPLAPALAVMLGADIGTTLVVQALAFDLKAVIPVLLLIGVPMFMVAPGAVGRHVGRIVIGVALMILSLGLITGATVPLRENWLFALVLQHLGQEAMLALLLGAALTWLVHSSVAMVLFIITLAASGVLDADMALMLVLGANIGSGLIPLGLALRSGLAARRILLGNLAFRAIGAFAALALVEPVAALMAGYGIAAPRQVALAHTGFNLLVAAVFLPLTGVAARLLERFVTPPPALPGTQVLAHLNENELERPAVALSGATREVLRMAERVEIMLREAILPFQENDGARRDQIRELDQGVDDLQEAIKLYLTRLTRRQLSEEDARRAFDLILFTTNLEHVGDIIDKSLLVLAAKKQRLQVSFSPEGWQELTQMHRLAVEHMRLAVTVFVTRDADLARDLVRAKEHVRQIEREATEGHLRRLREGTIASIETSSLHMDMLRDLKRIIAHLTTVAHPILEASGELRETRLRGKPGPEAPSAVPSVEPA